MHHKLTVPLARYAKANKLKTCKGWPKAKRVVRRYERFSKKKGL